jgi:hypothetical protein
MLLIFGVHGIQLTLDQALKSDFNSELEAKLFVWFDEAAFLADGSITAQLRGLITENTLMISEKHEGIGHSSWLLAQRPSIGVLLNP